MAPPHSSYSSTEIWIELEFGNVGFLGEGKTGVPAEKPLGAEKRTNNKLNPHIICVEFENRPRAKSVGGKYSHYCAIPAPLTWSLGDTKFLIVLKNILTISCAPS